MSGHNIAEQDYQINNHAKHEELQSAENSNSCRDLLKFIRERNLTAVALVFLELYRPLAGIGDALIIFSQPFLKAFSYQRAALDVFRSRDKVDWLIAELERPNADNKEIAGR